LATDAARSHERAREHVSAADQVLKIVRNCAKSQQWLPSARTAKRTRIEELLDAHAATLRLRGVRSSAQIQSHLKPVREHFGDWFSVDLTAAAVDTYIEARLEADKAPATINRETQLLGQAMRLALERGQITAVPAIRPLPERNTRQGFFERPEFEAVVVALPEHLRDMCRFGWLTGWRRGEILTLRWTDVDLDGGAIRLRAEASKNGRGRTVMLGGGELGALIARRERARLVDREDGHPLVPDLVFHRDGEPIVDFRKAWATACVAGGLYRTVKREDGTAWSRTGCSMTCGAPPCATWCGRACQSGWRWRSRATRPGVCSTGTTSWSEGDLREAMRLQSAYVESLPRTGPAIPAGSR